MGTTLKRVDVANYPQTTIVSLGMDAGYNTLIDWCSDDKKACNPIVNATAACQQSGGAFATIAAIES